MMQFQCVPTTYVTENKENYLKIYTYQVSFPLSLRLLNIPNCQSVLKYLIYSMANCLHVYMYLYDSNIS